MFPSRLLAPRQKSLQRDPHRLCGQSPAKLERISFFSVMALVIAFYFWTAMSNGPYPSDASSYYYPLLARAFDEGQLSLDVPPAPQLLALPDPYNPDLNKPYRLHDASLYHGKYYLYFGLTPVMLLFWPYFFLTGHFFPQYLAVPIFCSIGFIFSALLFLAIVRDHFPEVPLWLSTACVAALGMSNICPFLLRRPDVYEVAIACAYALLQLAFFFFYRAWKLPQPVSIWMLAVSACLGASVGAHYNYSLIVVLFSVILIWRSGRSFARRESRPWLPLLALWPCVVIGLLLAAYNDARFGNPFEFGQRYQLSGVDARTVQFTRLDNIPYSLWFYFFSPPRLSPDFPFMDAWPLPWFKLPGHFILEKVSGLFIISPVTLLALALPVFLVRRRERKDRPLAVPLLFMAGSVLVIVLPFLCFSGATMRYEVDFAPTLVLLGCLMLCHLYCLPWRTKMGRWALHGLLVVMLLMGLWSGLCLSFTGYYDFLRYGSPEAYLVLEQLFHPLEVVFNAIADLFGA
jgi:hypothetical protein